MKEKIKQFCKAYDLGTVTEEPGSISGGLLHAMYRVKTDKGTYAVKILNPEIMQRPAALQNMINSEKVSHALVEVVPLVAAKEFDGKHVVEFDGTWFMTFDWQDGTAVFAPDITVQHCAKVGQVLGKIHAANVQINGIVKESECRDLFDWNGLVVKLEQAENVSVPCYEMLKNYLPELLRLDEETVTALQTLAEHQVISHRDLDPKNIMWQGSEPYLIDWEAAGYVNPYQELAEVLNYWITDADGSCNYEKFTALMDEYAKSINVKSVDWDVVLKSGFDGMLGWLEYNVKRAAGLCGNSIEECKTGEEQVLGTIAELKRQRTQMKQLKHWLNMDLNRIFREEDLFPREFAAFEERDYGLLFFDESNKDSYDSNHAVIFKEKITDFDAVLRDVSGFYRSKDTNPILYQAMADDGFFAEQAEVFARHGLRVWEEEQRFMVPAEENRLVTNPDITVKRVTEWEDIFASEIFEKAEEPWEIEVAKKMSQNPNCMFFVAYYKNCPVGMTYGHVRDGVCRYDYILVSKEHRRIGVARALMNALVEYCKVQGIENCSLWPAGESAERIYLEAGFRTVAVKKAGRAAMEALC